MQIVLARRLPVPPVRVQWPTKGNTRVCCILTRSRLDDHIASFAVRFS